LAEKTDISNPEKLTEDGENNMCGKNKILKTRAKDCA
jgi:hypothetical protein